jgi:hypothetical protein
MFSHSHLHRHAFKQIAYLPRCRTYALSRFPTRSTGISRTRTSERIQPLPRRSETIPSEQTPSGETSQLWHTSGRPPGSNASESLTRLLQNDTLIIERYLLTLAYQLDDTYQLMQDRSKCSTYSWVSSSLTDTPSVRVQPAHGSCPVITILICRQ